MDTSIAQYIVTQLDPILVLMLSAMIGLWAKEVVTDLVASIRWKMKDGFEPGDIVYLDGEQATIISIGFTETIFEIDNGRGKVWRYIKNTRIWTHRLEKVIIKRDPTQAHK